MWVSFSTSLSKHKAHIENPKFLTPGGGEIIVVVIVIVVVAVVCLIVLVSAAPEISTWQSLPTPSPQDGSSGGLLRSGISHLFGRLAFADWLGRPTM